MAAAAFLTCTFVAAGGTAAGPPPTLARLCFRVAPDRIPEFRRAYALELAPILRQAGLVASTLPQRATIDSACCFLFEFQDAEAFQRRSAELGIQLLGREDVAEATRRLADRFRPRLRKGRLWSTFDLYQCPPVRGDTVQAGPGRGRWRSFDLSDGMPNSEIRGILHASDGYLWLGTTGGGVCRFDGREFEQVDTGVRGRFCSL